MDDLLILILARGGSKRLPGKHVRPLAGKTLLERTQAAIDASGLEAPCLFTTDDAGLAEVGQRLGWTVPFLRPSDLARDETPTVDVVLHALDWHRDATGSDPATVTVLQPTSPFRRGETLRRGVELLEADTEADAVVAVSRLAVGARHVFTFGDGKFLCRLTTDDNRYPVCCPNGSLYVIRASVLRRVRDLYPNRVRPLETDPIEAIDIDTEADWFLAEALARAEASFPEIAVATKEFGQSGVAW